MKRQKRFQIALWCWRVLGMAGVLVFWIGIIGEETFAASPVLRYVAFPLSFISYLVVCWVLQYFSQKQPKQKK